MAPASGFRTFTVIYCGQLVSLVGSAMSGFALGVYLYLLTGSVTTLGIAVVLFLLPLIVVSPLGGSLVDRWGVRAVLVLSGIGAMAAVLILATLMITGVTAIWHIYAFIAVTSGLRAMQEPAFETSVPLLVPKRHIGRANGMRLSAVAAGETLAPLSAGFLLLLIGVEGILLLHGAAFGIALVTLMFVRVPRAQHPTEGDAQSKSSTAFREAWFYLLARPGLMALLAFVGAVSFTGGFVDLLHMPLVLDFASPDALGMVLTIGGLGMILASLAFSIWGGPRQRVRGVLGFSLVLAVAIVLASLRPSVPLIATAAFFFMASSVIISGCVQNIWQTKIDPRLLGRAIALKNMVTVTPQLLGTLTAGPVVDHIFNPLVGRDQVRSSTVATLVGDGPGRGIALLLMIMGIATAVIVLIGYLYPRLRNLEDEIPDAIDTDTPVAEPPGETATEPGGEPVSDAAAAARM